MLSKETAVRDVFPHYTNPLFRDERTTFGVKEPGLSYDYSDRISHWYSAETLDSAIALARASGHAEHSVRYFEVYLSALFGRTVEIAHIVSGVNRSNGYQICLLNGI